MRAPTPPRRPRPPRAPTTTVGPTIAWLEDYGTLDGTEDIAAIISMRAAERLASEMGTKRSWWLENCARVEVVAGIAAEQDVEGAAPNWGLLAEDLEAAATWGCAGDATRGGQELASAGKWAEEIQVWLEART